LESRNKSQPKPLAERDHSAIGVVEPENDADDFFGDHKLGGVPRSVKSWDFRASIGIAE
jgi:hypothetical protein